MIRYRRVLGREDREAAAYTSSIREDSWLAPYIVEVLAAHLAALAENRVVDSSKLSCPARILLNLLKDPEPYEKVVEEVGEAEDFFEALEAYLYKLCGEAAGYIPVGRSRNDQVAATLLLAVRDGILRLLGELIELRRSLVRKAREYKDTVIPVYTHLQVAQAAWAADYLLAFEEAFSDSWRMLRHAVDMLSKSPLGSGPAAGTMARFPERTWDKLLCFDVERREPYYATSSRLLVLSAVSLVAVLMTELSRMAEDFVILSSQGFMIMDFSDELVATSSIMPHKRNPVVAEIMRARGGEAVGDLAAALAIYKGLPYGYNLDLQEVNKSLHRLLDSAIRSVRVGTRLINGLKISREAAARLLQGSVYWGQELSESLALKQQAPFRQVYFKVASALRSDDWRPGLETRQLLEEAGLDPSKPGELVLSRDGDPGTRIIEAERGIEADEKSLHRVEEKLRECRCRLEAHLSGIAG